MNETKHTPAPWVYLRHQTGEKYIHQGDRFLGANGPIVGEACGGTDAITDANGRLQAASPELLGVLRAFLAEFREIHPGSKTLVTQEYSTLGEMFDAASALIAKATGQETT